MSDAKDNGVRWLVIGITEDGDRTVIEQYRTKDRATWRRDHLVDELEGYADIIVEDAGGPGSNDDGRNPKRKEPAVKHTNGAATASYSAVLERMRQIGPTVTIGQLTAELGHVGNHTYYKARRELGFPIAQTTPRGPTVPKAAAPAVATPKPAKAIPAAKLADPAIAAAPPDRLDQAVDMVAALMAAARKIGFGRARMLLERLEAMDTEVAR
jgi:hypothetical protein